MALSFVIRPISKQQIVGHPEAGGFILKKMTHNLRQYLVFCFFIVASCGALARDKFSYNEGTWGTNATRSRQISLGFPPIGLPSFYWLNSFDYQQWQDGFSPYSSFRWSTGFKAPLDEKTSFLIFHNESFSSTENIPTPTPEATFTSLIATVSNQVDSRRSWSYGFIVTDKSNAQRLYPALGYRYQTEDMKWLLNFGFPTIGMTYFGIERTDISLLITRETARFSVTDKAKFGPGIKYVEQNFNSVGFALKRHISAHLNFNARYAYLFASRWHLQNSAFETQSDGIDYSQQSVFTVGLSLE